MSGVQGQVLGHLARRGVELASTYGLSYKQQLEADAELYENSGPEGRINPEEMFPVLFTAIFALVIVAAIRYTIGEVVATLAMIETPTATAIIEDKPPAYADEPDAPLEKEPLMPSEAQADVEVLLVDNKPITTKVSSTIKHIVRIGGRRARYRGAGLSILYHLGHSITTNFLLHAAYSVGLPNFGPLTNALVYIFVSVAFARLHMSWTHAIISMPSSKPWYRKMVARKQSKLVLLPSLVFACAQQATILIPMGVFIIVDTITYDTFHDNTPRMCAGTVLQALGFLTVPLSGLITALCFLLPAAATLTRVEAALLPEGEETIVPFDRSVVVGDVDISARGSSKAVFRQAWRSFGCAARFRLVKIYTKMMMVQVAVLFIAAHVMLAEVYIIGGERLAPLVKSGIAQLRLAAIEAQEQAAN